MLSAKSFVAVHSLSFFKCKSATLFFRPLFLSACIDAEITNLFYTSHQRVHRTATVVKFDVVSRL